MISKVGGVVALGWALSVVGCAHDAPPASSSAGGDEKKAEVVWPKGEKAEAVEVKAGDKPVKPFVLNETFKLTDAVGIPKLRKTAEQLSYVFKIDSAVSDKPLYFGELTNSDELTLPVIVVKSEGQLKALRLEKQYGADLWQRVLTGPHPKEIWGVLDQAEEDRVETMKIVHSTDGGATWQAAVIRKPSADAGFYDFILGRDGKGRLTVQVPEAEDHSNVKQAGLYQYRTTDGGKTWTAAEFESDQTKPADDVPDDEQPEQGATA